MQAIELSPGACIELAAVAADAVKDGLGVRLWLRPGALKPGAVVFTLGDDRASQVALTIGERGALRPSTSRSRPGSTTARRRASPSRRACSACSAVRG